MRCPRIRYLSLLLQTLLSLPPASRFLYRLDGISVMQEPVQILPMQHIYYTILCIYCQDIFLNFSFFIQKSINPKPGRIRIYNSSAEALRRKHYERHSRHKEQYGKRSRNFNIHRFFCGSAVILEERIAHLG